MPYAQTIHAAPDFFQTLGIDLAGSVYSSLAQPSTMHPLAQGSVDWASLARASDFSGLNHNANHIEDSTFTTPYAGSPMNASRLAAPELANGRSPNEPEAEPRADVGRRAIAHTKGLVAKVVSVNVRPMSDRS